MRYKPTSLTNDTASLLTFSTLKLAVSLLLAMASMCQAQPRLVVPPNNAVAGFSQAEWSRKWWEWAGSFESHESPVADRTGELCGGKQDGPVWFLAGTYGTQRAVRTCKVPKDKYIFFPLINYVVMPRPIGQTSCPEIVEKAKEVTDTPVFLILDVDGVRIGNLATQRQATNGCFDMGALTQRKFKIFPSAANGYYAMLYPLAAGRHTLNFGGSLPDMSQAVTYTLIAE